MNGEVLELVKEFVNSYLIELDKQVVVESEVMYGNNKLEYALSIKEYMASISVLPDLTYDFFAVEIESEETLMVKTKKFKTIDELFSDLKEDISSFANLK